jgi:hypothetical protein
VWSAAYIICCDDASTADALATGQEVRDGDVRHFKFNA